MTILFEHIFENCQTIGDVLDLDRGVREDEK